MTFETKINLTAQDVVMIDGHVFDVFVDVDIAGQLSQARPVLIGILHMRNRAVLSWSIGTKASSELIRLALMNCLRDYGLPHQCVIDNGGVFASCSFSDGVSPWAVGIECEAMIAFLGIKSYVVRPHSGMAKPIERTWRDLCLRISQRMAQSPTQHAALSLNDVRKIISSEVTSHNERVASLPQVSVSVHVPLSTAS